MTLRYKSSHEIRVASRFTPNSSEVNVGDASVPIDRLEVLLGDEWKCLKQAMADKDVIPNNHDTWFRAPRNEFEKLQGYFW